jgi:hypothetical protein
MSSKHAVMIIFIVRCDVVMAFPHQAFGDYGLAPAMQEQKTSQDHEPCRR